MGRFSGRARAHRPQPVDRMYLFTVHLSRGRTIGEIVPYGRISIGVPLATAPQISSIAVLPTEMHPSVQSL